MERILKQCPYAFLMIIFLTTSNVMAKEEDSLVRHRSGTYIPAVSDPDACNYTRRNPREKGCDGWSVLMEDPDPDACKYTRQEHRENRYEHLEGKKCDRWYEAREEKTAYVPPRTTVITLKGIHFYFDRSDIRPESLPKLEENLQVLKSRPNIDIKIVGHTDSIGTEKYNQGLSERRAESVRNYFISHGVDPTRIGMEGRGESEPVDTNETPEGRFNNRRIEIHITDR